MKTREDAFKMHNGYKYEKGKFHPPITTLNAVSEELLLPNKMFRDAALNRRCLVLPSEFYDWRHVYPKNKKTGAPLKTALKYLYRVGVKEKEYFYMAGIWQPWTDAETAEYAETFAIVTTAANELMAQEHNSKKRMPTILTEELAYDWMFGELDEKRISEIAQFQFPAEQMEACTIAKDLEKRWIRRKGLNMLSCRGWSCLNCDFFDFNDKYDYSYEIQTIIGFQRNYYVRATRTLAVSSFIKETNFYFTNKVI